MNLAAGDVVEISERGSGGDVEVPSKFLSGAAYDNSLSQEVCTRAAGRFFLD
jgi:hypothetical protein